VVGPAGLRPVGMGHLPLGQHILRGPNGV
jgi:hypothetical protein